MTNLGVFLIGVALLGSSYISQAQEPSKAGPPNVVLILVDDMGLMDLGAFGGETHTPNIDRLAERGVKFTNLHASPVCAPSRAMLITGSDSHLTGVPNLPEMLPEEYQGIPGYEGVLNDQVQTIATRLKEREYNTYVTGKWHLGHDENTLPHVRGFDRSFVLSGSGSDNYSTEGYLPFKPKTQWYADGEVTELPEGFYSSEHYVDELIRYHKEEDRPDRPFFSYLAFQALHAPLQAPTEYVEKYLEVYAEGWDVLREVRFAKAKELGIIPKSATMNPTFEGHRAWKELTEDEQRDHATDMAMLAGMLEAMDYHVGRYIAYLEEAGLAENTVFVVTSDNGPDGGDYSPLYRWAERTQGYHRDFEEQGGYRYYGSLGPEYASALAAPFSYYKYYTGEGGLRVPLIMMGPGLPKQQTDGTFCFLTDIAPTIYELAGLSPEANPGYSPITGKSILPHLQDPSIPIYGPQEGVGLEAAACAAYFLGDYKIVLNNSPLSDDQWKLYNIAKDPTETKNLAAEEPLQFQIMLSAYERWAQEVGVVTMPEGYSAQGEVGKKSVRAIVRPIRK
ncbi:MAG: arylsulfatase [Bacteroidota bacterium]